MMNKFLVILTLVSAVGSEIKAEKYTDVHDVYNRCYPTLPWNRYKDVCGPEFAKLRDEINKLDESGSTVLDRSRQDGNRFRFSVEGAAARAAAKIIVALGGKNGYAVRVEVDQKKELDRLSKIKEAEYQRLMAEIRKKQAEEVVRLKAESDRKSQEAERLAKAELSRVRDILVPVKTENAPQADDRALVSSEPVAQKDSDLLKWGRCCC